MARFLQWVLFGIGIDRDPAITVFEPDLKPPGRSGRSNANKYSATRIGRQYPHPAVREEEIAMEEKRTLSAEEGRLLLRIARGTIDQRLTGTGDPVEPDPDLQAVLREPHGSFVTLTAGGRLRGCIGCIRPREPLLEELRRNALNAAFCDPRFPPLTAREWQDIHIEVSILTTPRPLVFRSADDLLDKLRPGVDGVILRKGGCQATFLPQVWEQLPDKKDFLTQLCYKAGLEGEAWCGAGLEVSTYQVEAFEE